MRSVGAHRSPENQLQTIYTFVQSYYTNKIITLIKREKIIISFLRIECRILIAASRRIVKNLNVSSVQIPIQVLDFAEHSLIVVNMK